MKYISEKKILCGKVNIFMAALIVQGVIYLLRGSISDILLANVNSIFINTSHESSLIIKIVFDALLYAVSFVIPIMLYFFLSGEKVALGGIKNIGTHQNPIISAASAAGIISAVGMVAVWGYVSKYLFQLMDSSGVHIYQNGTEMPVTAVGLILYFIAAVVIPAIAEEVLFREIALKVFIPFGKTFSILVSSLFFALMHMDPSKFLYAFAGGMVFSYYTLKSGSVLFAVTAHFSVNMLSFALQLIEKYCSANVLSITNTICFSLAFAVSLISGAAFIKKLKKSDAKPHKTLMDSSPTSIRTGIAQIVTLPMVVYLAFTLYMTFRRFYFG